jgi:CDP-glycerol glycerophosphotransferase (TagB/SpsB family)
VYALGSPNFLTELPGALAFAQKLQENQMGDIQLLIRPHPMFFTTTDLEPLEQYPNVHVQKTGVPGIALENQVQDESAVQDWVNTFRHADVVINLSSTVAVDAAIFDRPVINLDFDPEPGQPNQELVKDINHVWTHFKPIAESGGLWLVTNYDEMIEAVKTYLEKPDVHRERRRWIADFVCGPLDGRSGERIAEAILDFAHR